MKNKIKFLKTERQKIIDELKAEKFILVIDYFVHKSNEIQSIDFLIKELQKESKEKKQRVEDDESYITPQLEIFRPVWYSWLKYKTDRKESYKTISSKEAAFKRLLKLSNYNEATAKLMIEESIVNNWKGFFKTKNNEIDLVNQNTMK